MAPWWMNPIMAEICPEESLTDDMLLGEFAGDSYAPKTVHQCMVYILESLGFRTRLFIKEGTDLVLRDCVGTYDQPPKPGTKVHPAGILRDIFRNGRPVRVIESRLQKESSDLRTDNAAIKAIIPLNTGERNGDNVRTLGLLLIDAEEYSGTINDRDFEYLKILGVLISEIIQRSVLLNRIRQMHSESEEITREIAHIFRNRFTVIGGFARNLSKNLRDPVLRKKAGIILKEAETGEKDLEQWIKSHEKGGEV
jgi:signal transduction histidine kinase